MLNVLITLAIIIVAAFVLTILFNKKIEEAIPMFIIYTICYLYLFYMLDFIKVGYYTLIFQIIIGLCVSIKKVINCSNKKKLLNKMITPGFFVYIICSIIIFMITKKNYVMYFDELRLWAAYPKSIFTFEKLMIGKNLVFSSEYFPGMPLFQYFVAKNGNQFIESQLYFSYCLCMLSLIIISFKNVKWEKWYLIIPGIAGMIFLPLLFANSGFDMLYYYKTLYIDPALGIAFGFSLYLSTRNLKEDKFYYILFLLSLSLCILFKIVGVVFALLSFFNFILIELVIRKKYKSLKKNLIFLILPICVILLTFFSWNLVINFHSDKTDKSLTGISIKQSIRLIVKPSEEEKEFRKEFIKKINETSFVKSDNYVSKYFTGPNIITSLLIIYFLLFFINNKKNRKEIIGILITILVSFILYNLMYYIIFTFTFHRTILCYERYASSLYMGYLILTVLYISDIKEIKNKSLYYFLIIVIYSLSYLDIYKINEYKYEENIKKETIEISKLLLQNINESSNILTVYNTCDTITYTCVLRQHHLFLEMLDKKMNISPALYIMDKNSFNTFYSDDQNKYFIDSLGNKRLNIKSFIDNIDYVVIVENIDEKNIDKETKKEFGSNIKFGDIYKVLPNKELERIN